MTRGRAKLSNLCGLRIIIILFLLPIIDLLSGVLFSRSKTAADGQSGTSLRIAARRRALFTCNPHRRSYAWERQRRRGTFFLHSFFFVLEWAMYGYSHNNTNVAAQALPRARVMFRRRPSRAARSQFPASTLQCSNGGLLMDVVRRYLCIKLQY